MIVRTVYPHPTAPIDTTSPDARALLALLYPPPALRVNLVASVDGRTRDESGTSAGITAGADRAILGAIRSVSDTVLLGAGTLRAEPDLVPRSAHLTVITRHGDFEGTTLRDGLGTRDLLVTGPADAEETARRTLRAPFEYLAIEGGLGETVARLHERFPRIVCEGGPSLARGLLSAGLVDEICLSTSPFLLGGDRSRLSDEFTALGLTQLLTDDAGVVYARWKVSPPAPPSIE